MNTFAKVIIHAFAIARFLAPASTKGGAPGEIDSTFNPTIQFVGAFAIQKDQKIVCVGDFTSVNGVARSRIARLHPNGALDATFLGSSEGANKWVQSVALQADGKILICGDFDTLNYATCKILARLNSDGRPDKSFASPTLGSPGSRIWNITMLPDQKILVGGEFDVINDSVHQKFARLNADGTVDESFNYKPEAGWDRVPAITAVGFQSNGRILISLNSTMAFLPKYKGVVRLMPDGGIDQSFIGAPFGGGRIGCMAVQPDDKILVGGFFYINDGGNFIAQHLLRLNADGSIDSTFKNGVLGSGLAFTSIYAAPTGDILAAAMFSYTGNVNTEFKVARLRSDGSLDPTFRALFPREPTQMTRYAPGQILLCGYSTGFFRMFFPTEAPPPPQLRSISAIDGKVRLEWEPTEGNKLSVQVKNDLSQGDWNTLAPEASFLETGAVTITEEPTDASSRFYRLVRE